MGVVTQIVALMPKLTEKGDPSQELQPEALIQEANPKEAPPLAPGIPQDKVPDYAIEDFQYVSTVQGRRQWKINSTRAFLYNHEKVVSTRIVHAELYDPEGQVILVTAREAKYFMNGRNLELFGEVQATFPDGFRLESEYMLYQPSKGLFTAPTAYLVKGYGKENSVDYSFTSEGLSYSSTTGELKLPQKVRMVFLRKPASGHSIERTHVFADECEMHRKVQQADCRPAEGRPPELRYVQIAQLGHDRMAAKARRGHVAYASGTGKHLIHYVTLLDDVVIAEDEISRGRSSKDLAELMETFAPERIALATRQPGARYSTSGRADFDASRDIIVLTDYPQVYQASDTITGERILMHRDSDLVEIDHSNAYSEGSTAE